MAKLIRLGIVGSGIAARKLHLPALRKLSEFYEITAVTSGHVENAQKFADLFEKKPRVFNDYHHMMISGLVDAVDLTVPPQFNFEIVQDALRNGIHVICEKPIAENVESAKKIINMSRSYDRVFMVAESQRYDPELNQITDLIRMDEIGTPELFDWNVIVNFGKDNEYVNTSWRKNPKHIGGFLSDGGVHNIAVLRAIFGEVESVSGMVSKVSDYIGGDDTMVLNMKFKNGVIGNYSVSYALDAPAHKSLKIYGTRGKIRATPREVEVIKKNGTKKYPSPLTNLFVEEFKEFYSAINEGIPIELGRPESALRDLAIIEAGINSARTGCAIHIEELLE